MKTPIIKTHARVSFSQLITLPWHGTNSCEIRIAEMSGYDNVVAGKLKLKGKALDVKAGGIKKKKKHKKQYGYEQSSHLTTVDHTSGGSPGLSNNMVNIDSGKDETSKYGDHLTPAERKYLQQWEKINVKKLAQEATKSHRDRIQEFNQYLANLSEHYDIPKVGPG